VVNELAIWGAFGLSGAGGIAIISFWMTLSSRLTTAELKAAMAERDAASAHTKYDGVIRDVSDYRVAVEVKIAIVKTLAEANTTSLTAAENRVARALEEVRDELSRFNERIDRAFADK